MSLLRKRKVDGIQESMRPQKVPRTISLPAKNATNIIREQITTSPILKELTTNTRQKRKRVFEECSEVDEQKQPRQTPPIRTPKKQRIVLPPSPAETPSRKTARLFDQLDIHGKRAAYDTPPATPEAVLDGFKDILPSGLREYISMYAALISALNEQIALNSTEFRIGVRDLLIVMTNVWSKRKVELDDLRKLVALSKHDLGWQLEDFGRAGVHMVRKSSKLEILDSLRLRAAFEKDLRAQWTRWQSKDITMFLDQVQLSSIPQSETVDQTATLHSRGKDRLTQLKLGQQQALAVPVIESSAADTTTRGTKLLDRILAKQAVNAALPAGPSKQQIERRFAVQRVEEIARVLDVLSAGRARASFSMQSVVQQLQQSLRNPISRVDVERCLTLMAVEIMPQFVSIIATGSVVGVVITRAGKLGLADLKQKLADIDI